MMSVGVKSPLPPRTQGAARAGPATLVASTSFCRAARFLASQLPMMVSVVGVLGGVCLHSPRFRELFGRQLRRLTPRRLLP